MTYIALSIFICMYIGMLIFSKWRMFFALGAAVLMAVFGIVGLHDIPGAINWNVIMMITGTMGVVTLFIETGAPSRMADEILTRMHNSCWAIIALAVFAGLISAFVDNVATVLMVAPVGLAIAKKIGMNPVPAIISIVVSSNLQGAATLVGDTTSILLGDYAGMTFMDFIFWQGKPSIFWAVELGAVGTVVILWLMFKKEKRKINSVEKTPVSDIIPGGALLVLIILLIIASFFEIPIIDDFKNGIICITVCLIDLIRSVRKTRSLSPVKLVIKEFDYQTILMLCGLFIVIKGIKTAGIIDDIALWFSEIGDNNLFMLYTIIVFGSVLISAFVDNIPYVATMLPVVQSLSSTLAINPEVLYFGLLTGATLGGNITPFGASANVAGIGILQKEGYTVKTKDFLKMGIPFTFTAVLIGYLFIWFVWR